MFGNKDIEKTDEIATKTAILLHYHQPCHKTATFNSGRFVTPEALI